jgi:hypothetical protein
MQYNSTSLANTRISTLTGTPGWEQLIAKVNRSRGLPRFIADGNSQDSCPAINRRTGLPGCKYFTVLIPNNGKCISDCKVVHRSRDSSVGIATAYGLDGIKNFLFFK